MPTPTCRHLHTDGRPCGSPALRGEPFCFHHHTARKPMPRRQTDNLCDPQLPAPDDFLAIQRAIGEVLRLLAMDALPDKRAANLLRGLAIASANLARHHRREEKLAAQAAATGVPTPAPVTDYTNDPTHGTLAPDPTTPPPASSDLQPVPDPIPLLTPDPSRGTTYDQAMFTEIHQHFSAIFRDKLAHFEHQKSLELEALYDDRYATLQADFEARLAQHKAQLQDPIRIHPQQNQDLTQNEQNHFALAS